MSEYDPVARDASRTTATARARIVELEKERDDYRDLFRHAAFALWGQPQAKQDEAEKALAWKMVVMGIDWNGEPLCPPS